MSHACPHCKCPLTHSTTGFDCANCNTHFAHRALCPDCQQPLQLLAACGAVDYFCQHGHGLISKKRVEFIPDIPST